MNDSNFYIIIDVLQWQPMYAHTSKSGLLCVFKYVFVFHREEANSEKLRFVTQGGGSSK